MMIGGLSTSNPYTSTHLNTTDRPREHESMRDRPRYRPYFLRNDSPQRHGQAYAVDPVAAFALSPEVCYSTIFLGAKPLK